MTSTSEDDTKGTSLVVLGCGKVGFFRRLFAISVDASLEERIEKLEDELKSLRLDWEDIYERCRRLLGRAVKERGRIEAAATRQEEPAVDSSTNGTHGGFLTQHQKNIQQQILKRRARLTEE